MARPAIVIGLGGTGQWVLTFLKKDLLEVGGGEMPPGVRLLCFDTTSQTQARTGQRRNRGTDEEEIRAGAVELTPNIEFIPIGDNVMDLATQIASGEHPHLQWFPANSLISKLPPAAFNTKEGSGQIRHMGRISLFRDLSAIQRSKILARLRDAIQAQQRDVTRDRQLEIIIVSSLAGGTGAGMLADMALLVRAQASALVQRNYVVRGFFLLPRAFTAGGLGEDQDMLARSFAAWRELDRFMIVSERFGVRQINYHQRNQDLRIRTDRRAYDVSYLVDPARSGANSLENVKNEEGVYPAMAYAISAILDDIAGQAYTEFVSTNLSGKLAQLPRRPYHSAIGSYTLKVPVFYAREKFTHQLSQEVLDLWLAPVKNERGVVTAVSEHANKEADQGAAGWPSVRSFMSSSAINYGGDEIPNTDLMPLIAQVRDEDGQLNGEVINRWAKSRFSQQGHPVVQAITEISQDEEGKKLKADINTELRFRIWEQLPPSRVAGDHPPQSYRRIIPRVPELREKHYGKDDVYGRRLRGDYGEALEKAQGAQLARFRRLLHAWTLNTLNGRNSDPQIARSGKLGYVSAFYGELDKTLNYYVGFLDKVRAERNDVLKLGATARRRAGAAQETFNRDKDKKAWLTVWDSNTHPDAYEAETAYLEAEQRSIDIRKEDILLDVHAETALEMQKYVAKTLEELENWIAHLATGGPGVNSLYSAAAESLDNVQVNHELDKDLDRVSELIGEHEYKTQADFINEVLGRIEWAVEIGAEQLAVACGVSIPSDDQNVPDRYVGFRRSGEEPEKFNLRKLFTMAEMPYHNLHQERPLAREVMAKYETGTELADATWDKAEPMYLPSTNKIGPQVTTCYIRVHSNVNEETNEYFESYEKQMRAHKTPKGSSLTLVDSEDKHKLTMVQSDDLMPSTDFDMWKACRDAYIRQITDPQRGIPAAELHVFPAEINACYYEEKMPRLLRQDYRTLHPEVVALLEDRERFEMFFRAKALGFITLAHENHQPYWVYKLPDEKESLFITVPSETLEGRTKEDVFQVIHNFVLEGRDQRPGVGNAIRVDWGKLRQTILATQRELGIKKAAAAYNREISKGVVKEMRDEAEQQRNREPDEALRSMVAQELVDLADAANVVYLQAAESLKQ